ncbi:Os07g0207700 [Oryza sativa Japonica Group]|uniref:Os07g0207700 protein n=1 Tax=Oryza sativa subsp. japonica TaxID=39947 RepID=A0A0P0X3R4_ORYSJ|nr:hypothetical protein EE612_037786 [Oryza sativa]BAT00565.1 Os07g0207700 [Oryza sativa Japonica Group]
MHLFLLLGQQSDDNVDGRPCNSIFSPAYHLQKECGASNFAKGIYNCHILNSSFDAVIVKFWTRTL